MARIIALDYGKKRTGIAVTDPLQIIATALDTVDTNELIGYLKRYFSKEEVESAVIGYPLNFDDTPTDATPLVEKFIPNVHSCAFIATEDIGKLNEDGSFEVLGRMDHSALRGCSLMTA